MAAYASLVSLMQIIHQIETHPTPPISMDRKQVESLTEIVVFLQEFLEGYKSPFADGDEADPLEIRIADAVYAAEDVIESHIVDQIRPTIPASTDLYETLMNVIKQIDQIKEDMMKIVALKRQLQRQVPTPEDLHTCVVKVIGDMHLLKEEVLDNFAVNDQLQRSIDFYESLTNVIEVMNLIKRQVVLDFVPVKDQQQRQFSASADLNENVRAREMQLLEIAADKEERLRQVSAFAGSSTSTDGLYEDMMRQIEHKDLIKEKVMEVVALNDQLQIQVSPTSDMYEDIMKLVKYMDLIKKEVMEVIALKDQLHIQVSPSGDLNESLVKVIEDMNSIKKEVMLLDIVPVKDQLQRQVSADAGGSSTSSKMLSNNFSKSSLSRLNSTTMVGFNDVKLQLMDKLTDGRVGRHVIPIIGMGGIGKTTLARNVYEKPLITCHFDIYAWVTISQQYNTKELLREILSQANKLGLSQMSEDEIGLSLHKYLTNRRYLIVLDDMWSIEVWEKIQLYFPDNGNESRIMVTTRLSNLGSQLDSNYDIEMKFMDLESSWDLLCKTVFGGKFCPLELEKTGKEIVKRCRGLPLSIVVIGGLLEKLELTNECWESIMESITSLVNLENDKHCWKIMKLSYNHLSVYLKPCFLYMGTFKEDSQIRVSKVVNVWVSEGFLRPIRGKSLETVAKEYLDELVQRNLILVDEFGKTGNMKYLKMHDLLRDFCLREAEKERFYHVVGQHSPQGTRSQRRVVIPESTSEEKVLHAIGSTPHARSYIVERRRVRVLPKLRLLRTLQVRTQCIYWEKHYSMRKLYEFVNMGLLYVDSPQFIQLPSSINLLWNLQTFIISHHQGGKFAPVDIWNMPQLRHAHFWTPSGVSHLPNPPSDSIVIMDNLQTLKRVKNFKCDEMMVHRIPNIKKLGIFYTHCEGIESPGDYYCLHNIERLQKLESLNCYSFNFKSGDFYQKFTFPHSLKKLTLLKIDESLEDIMEKVSALPLLQMLKVSGGYFSTGKWETVEDRFLCLKYLSLSCHQLICWSTMETSHFPCLEKLELSYLKVLEEIPAVLGEIPTLKSVTLTGCSEAVVKSAKRMVKEQEESQGKDQLSFKVVVRLIMENEELLSLANPNFQVTTF